MTRYRRWFLAAILVSLAAGAAPASSSPERPSDDLASAVTLAPNNQGAPLFAPQPAPVCAATERTSCASDWLTKDGPGPFGDCCERHLEMCGNICACGFTGFNCWDNGHGGCSSQCVGCRICM